MYKVLFAKLLRSLPNKSAKNPTVDQPPLKVRKDFLIETSIEPTQVSLYYPLEARQEKYPVYINIHGGAFIMNDKEMDEPYCNYLANETGCAILNIEYVKAPEYPFPNAIQQSYEVLQWLKEEADDLEIDADKIMVGGQSSGGNIAAALCLHLESKQEKQPLLQYLSCPMLDFVTPHAEKPEPGIFRSQFPQAANFLNMSYVPEEEMARHPLASPVYADVTDTLAPALIIIAEHDAFRPEAEKYAEKLKAAGVEVQDEIFTDCKHAFTHLGPKEKAQEAWVLLARRIREASEG
ncbi:alpha/beta hydrolase [Salinicoccus cyprini]|uniref:Alpha/beta hydrolase n=1 Tax=Salinicoccus cyprini TaxID=2493691 RepID=A0A558AT16_9STAP|nr:alpha/beta hydrolase [Salinicoccus cyprini]TVT27407.1 alpha/beta hydrolase [Salinicoccus cyprini]